MKLAPILFSILFLFSGTIMTSHAESNLDSSASLPNQSETTPDQLVLIEDTLAINLPQVVILPDSPIYQLKLLWEKIRYAISSEEDKMPVLLDIARTRLSEAFSMAKIEKFDIADNMLTEYEKIRSYVAELSDTDIQIAQYKVNQEQFSLLNVFIGETKVKWER